MRSLFCILAASMLIGCKGKVGRPINLAGFSPAPVGLTNLPLQVRSYIERKEQLALTLAKKLGAKPDRATLEFFALARKGEFEAASRLCHDLRHRGGIVNSTGTDTNVTFALWGSLFEVDLTLEAYLKGAGKFAASQGEAVASSIPRGSIYFAGNKPGRGLASAFSTSSADEESFFILGQNGLSDCRHLAYLRAAFGDKAYMPSSEDSQKCFETYVEDARRRYEHDQKFPNEPRQLKPGEHVTMVDGKVQFSGHVAAMAINGLVAKVIFDKTPEREFYVEETFPIDWMYPHLSPHGLIMKINRQRVVELAPDVIARDRAFWSARQNEFIGGWLTPDTTVNEVCAFAEKVFLRKDLQGFQGDPDFVRNEYATATFSKLRASQAGLYRWRVNHPASTEDQQRMVTEADFAFRQAFAFCPSDITVIFRYVDLLVGVGRLDDAVLLMRTAAKLNPGENQLNTLLQELQHMKSTSK